MSKLLSFLLLAALLVAGSAKAITFVNGVEQGVSINDPAQNQNVASISNHLDTLQLQYTVTSNSVTGLCTTQGIVIANQASISNHLDILQASYNYTSNLVENVSNIVQEIHILALSNSVAGLALTQMDIINGLASVSNHVDTLQGQYLVTSNYVGGLSTTQGFVIANLASVSNQVNGGIATMGTATVSKVLNVTGYLISSNAAQADYIDDNARFTQTYPLFPYSSNGFKRTLAGGNLNGAISQIAISKGRQCVVYEDGSKKFWYSADAGMNWRPLANMTTVLGGTPVILALDCINNNTFVFGGGGSSTNIYMTTNFFQSVTTSYVNTANSSITAIKHSDNGVIIANTESGYVLVSTNYGVSWTSNNITDPAAGTVMRIAYAGKNNWIAMGKEGAYYSANNGSTWTKKASLSAYPMGCDAGVNGTVILCDGDIWRSTDYGQTFTTVKDLNVERGYSVSYAGNGVWFANPWGVDGLAGMTIYQSIDDGITWTSFNIPNASGATNQVNIWDMKMVGDTLVIAAGTTNGGIYVKGGSSFNDASAGESGMLWLKPQSTTPLAVQGGVYADSTGVLKQSTDGTNWNYISTLFDRSITATTNSLGTVNLLFSNNVVGAKMAKAVLPRESIQSPISLDNIGLSNYWRFATLPIASGTTLYDHLYPIGKHAYIFMWGKNSGSANSKFAYTYDDFRTSVAGTLPTGFQTISKMMDLGRGRFLMLGYNQVSLSTNWGSTWESAYAVDATYPTNMNRITSFCTDNAGGIALGFGGLIDTNSTSTRMVSNVANRIYYSTDLFVTATSYEITNGCVVPAVNNCMAIAYDSLRNIYYAAQLFSNQNITAVYSGTNLANMSQISTVSATGAGYPSQIQNGSALTVDEFGGLYLILTHISGNGSPDAMMYSADGGLTWTQRTAASPLAGSWWFKNYEYLGNNCWIGALQKQTQDDAYIIYSTDGFRTSQYKQLMQPDGAIFITTAVAHDKGKVIAISQNNVTNAAIFCDSQDMGPNNLGYEIILEPASFAPRATAGGFYQDAGGACYRCTNGTTWSTF